MLTLIAMLRLVTYNVNYANPDVAGAVAALAETDADVILLQEVTDAWKGPLKKLATTYPYQSFHIQGRRAGGLAVISKQPIKADELWSPPTGGYFPAERLLVETPLGSVQILHVHLRPNIDNGSWFVGYSTTPPVRKKEIETYWAKIDTSLPTIVAGDFNELPDGLAVKFLAEHGLARVPTTGPTTWHYEREVNGKNVSLLSMDIDHVVVDDKFTVATAEVLDKGASDHRPVVVTLERAPAAP
ncbi:MAG TPA: endonuclease/exonuclease/phosphatase family protein [Kofleriaceae bacterium]